MNWLVLGGNPPALKSTCLFVPSHAMRKVVKREEPASAWHHREGYPEDRQSQSQGQTSPHEAPPCVGCSRCGSRKHPAHATRGKTALSTSRPLSFEMAGRHGARSLSALRRRRSRRRPARPAGGIRGSARPPDASRRHHGRHGKAFRERWRAPGGPACRPNRPDILKTEENTAGQRTASRGEDGRAPGAYAIEASGDHVPVAGSKAVTAGVPTSLLMCPPGRVPAHPPYRSHAAPSRSQARTWPVHVAPPLVRE
jgi:hypothetical protein